MIYVPDKETVTARFGTSEMFILAITYDEETAAIAPIDEAPEHYILLNKAGIGEINLDRCFRVVFDDKAAEWTFVCPSDYAHIADKQKRIAQFYKDGFRTISHVLSDLGYMIDLTIRRNRVEKNIEKQDSDHFNLLVQRGGYKMTGRENKKDNDLFYTCSLIDYIARKTKNRRAVIVNALGRDRLAKIYDLADIYHSDNIDRVSDDFIKAAGILPGTFDNVADAKYAVPSHWDIGKVYKRLILGIAKERGIDAIDALIAAYNSFVSDKIDDYNSSFYYDNPQSILQTYLSGKLE